MCCIVEIALLVVGIVTLVRGEFFLTRKMVVRGVPAYVIGAILVAVLPLTFFIGITIGILADLLGENLAEFALRFSWINIALVAIALVAVVIISATNANHQPPSPTKFPTGPGQRPPGPRY